MQSLTCLQAGGRKGGPRSRLQGRPARGGQQPGMGGVRPGTPHLWSNLSVRGDAGGLGSKPWDLGGALSS